MSKEMKIELLRNELKFYSIRENQKTEQWWKNIVLLMAEIIAEEES